MTSNNEKCSLDMSNKTIIIISVSRRNLDYASQATLHPGYAGYDQFTGECKGLWQS